MTSHTGLTLCFSPGTSGGRRVVTPSYIEADLFEPSINVANLATVEGTLVNDLGVVVKSLGFTLGTAAGGESDNG